MSFSLGSELSKMISSGEPAKASITCEEVSALSLGEVAFNPDTLTITRIVTWETSGYSGSPWGALSYSSGSADTLTFTLLLDQTEYRPTSLLGRAALAVAPIGGDAASNALAKLLGWVNTDSVTDEMKALYALTLPVTAEDGSDMGMRPPVVLFQWGDFSFRGVVTSLTLTPLLFDESGNPRRATAVVVLTGRTTFDNPVTDLFDADYAPAYTATAGRDRGSATFGDARLSALKG